MALVNDGTVPYVVWFLALALVCFVVVMRSCSVDKFEATDEFKKFQRGFLVVYLLAMMADWMQGPYVYALYESYGFEIGAIGQLFIVGFGSSMIFGTFVGGLADRYGRKFNCLVFGVLYGLSCVTKHFNHYGILMIGRLLGGIATSILYSAFETWMVHEHKAHGFPEDWLSNTFAVMTFGNGVIAIVSGVVASGAASTFSLVAPFDLSLVTLIVCSLVVLFTWKENYGDSAESTGNYANFGKAWTILISNEKIVLLGLVQSCFESAMFIFVFMWTPALETHAEDVQIPHGLIFAGFMVCIMIGSNLFKSLSSGMSIENLLRFVFLGAAVFMTVPVLFGGLQSNLAAFCLFEGCCGIYFPSVGTLRGKLIPEEVRATIMNIFRVGLNLIVVLVLANIRNMSHNTVFTTCTFLLCVSTLAQHRLFALASTNATATEREADGLAAGEEVDGLLDTKEDVAA